MAKRKRAALLPTNIALLQNLIRRDPQSYREEFLLQHQHYVSLKEIFMMNPEGSEGQEEFAELVGFLSQVCSCYPEETASFPQELAVLLQENHLKLPSDLRSKIVQCLVMLRNKDVITSEQLVETLFPLLSRTDSKVLRTQLYTSLINLLKAQNQGTKNQRLNRSFQALLFALLNEEDANGLWATKFIRELWRRGIWDDSRSIEIMAQAALSKDVKVASSAARFFLSSDKERDEANQEDDDVDDEDLSTIRHKAQFNKKSGKRSKKVDAALKAMKKKSSSKHSATYLNFSAVHLLRDPQGFADKLYSAQLSRGNNRLNLEQKILFLNLISRLIGVHKLSVLGLYSYFLKYLTPKQKDVTQIMAAAAQASHEMVPPDLISPMVRKIADEFVSDGVAPEVAAAGINTIREIVSRAPLAIEAPLVQDLSEYKGSKSKPVMMAARSLIGLFREIAPEMLHRKDRGKTASMEMQSGEKSEETRAKFGLESSTVGIQGLDLLVKWRAEQGLNNDDVREDGEGNEEEIDGWEVASSASDSESDSEDGWVELESDQEYSISDSEDEDGNVKVKKSKAEKYADAVNADKEAFLKMASSRILTPADFAKLEELKLQAGLDKVMGKKTTLLRNEEQVEASTLTGPLKYKELREERIARAKEGRDGREFGSKKGKLDKPHSTTNREKARKKNFMMMVHKRDVQGKAKKSLRDKQKSLRAHIEKQKKKGF